MAPESIRFRWDPFVVVEVGDHEIRLRRGSAVTVLKGPEQSTVFRMMVERGWLDSPEFVVAPETLTDEAKYVLGGLRQNGSIREAQLVEPPAVVGEFCARSGGQAGEQEIAERLERTVVHVTGDHTTFAEMLIDVLVPLGVRAKFVGSLSRDYVRTLGSDDVVVAAYFDLFADTANRHNELLVSTRFTGRVFFLGGFDGRQSIVGPWVIAEKSACLECWNLRRRANMVDIPREIRPGEPPEHTVAYYGTRGVLPSYDGFTASYAADIVTEFVLLGELASSSQPGSYRTVEFSRNGIEIERHHVLRVPRCAVCGTAQSTGFPQVWHHG